MAFHAWVMNMSVERVDLAHLYSRYHPRFGYHLVRLPDSQHLPVQDGLLADYQGRQ